MVPGKEPGHGAREGAGEVVVGEVEHLEAGDAEEECVERAVEVVAAEVEGAELAEVGERVEWPPQVERTVREKETESFFTRNNAVIRAASRTALFAVTTGAGSGLPGSPPSMATPFSWHHREIKFLSALLDTIFKLAST